MQVTDDLYSGPTGPNGWSLQGTAAGNPTKQYGVGPLGRVAFLNIAPLAAVVFANSQTFSAGVPLALQASASIPRDVAPDGSGTQVLKFDVPRVPALLGGGDLSAFLFTLVGYDTYGQRVTETFHGPNLLGACRKAIASVVSITPAGSSATAISVSSGNTYGLPYRCIDASYIVSAKWDGALAQNAGTLVVADQTDPATALTGDVRGTFLPTGASPNGIRRLIIAMHVDGSQCGPQALRKNAIGVTQA